MKLRICAVVLCVAVRAPLSPADVFTSPALLEQQDQWSEWAASEQKVLLTGRYEGRSGSRVRLQKLEIIFFPERGVVIPDRIPLGSPLSVSGYFVGGKRTPEFRMTRFTLEPADVDRLRQRLQKIPDADPAARYQLADEYEAIATFYMDEELQAAVDLCRTSTFEAQRRRRREDPVALWKLVDPGPGFEVAERVRQLVRFEAFCLRVAGKPDASLRNDLQQHLPGWKDRAPDISPELRTAFADDRVSAYENADEAARRQLERLLYRQLRLRELRSTLKSDGSNALAVSARVAEELPEETAAVKRLESTWADYRLENVERLKRRQVDELVALLLRIGRTDDVESAADRWLATQESDFGDRGSDGQVRLAEDFLHAAVQWNLSEHRDTGIDYLKRAWTSASRESSRRVSEIEQRLANLGYRRLHNRWMTDSEVDSLPAGDIESAQQRGIVVPGMSSAQAEAIMGVPSRRIRMASSSSVEEFWVYGERHASRMLVRLRRPRSSPDAAATVIEVVLISGL